MNNPSSQGPPPSSGPLSSATPRASDNSPKMQYNCAGKEMDDAYFD